MPSLLAPRGIVSAEGVEMDGAILKTTFVLWKVSLLREAGEDLRQAACAGWGSHHLHKSPNPPVFKNQQKPL